MAPGKPFRNSYPTASHGLKEVIRWQWQTRGQFPAPHDFPLHTPAPDVLANPAPLPQLTWIGHASFLLQYQGTAILTDPVFSLRCSPSQRLGPKRVVPAALTVEQLPPVNAVLISHNHYDHLDHHTVVQLQRRFGNALTWYVPLGIAPWLRKRGVEQIVELGWWQAASHEHWSAVCLPTQHFSGRGAVDKNKTLWCSWRLNYHDGYSVYFAGDSGYAPIFKDIHAHQGPVDLALLPIGAYEPRWFMAPVHMNPDEAVRAHVDLAARQSIGMHWGTFVLTDEPVDEPPKALAEARKRYAVAERDFRVMAHGETLVLSGPEPS